MRGHGAEVRAFVALVAVLALIATVGCVAIFLVAVRLYP